MPAASPSRPGATSHDVRRPAANPWRLDLRGLGRRAGSMQEVERTLPAPPDWRVELMGVPEGGDVHVRLRLEAVMEGVLVTGDLDVPVVGSCARCLEPIEDTLHFDVQELYAYEGSTTEATSEEDEVRRIDGDFLDLEPLARDTVVLNLPLAPVCTPDCAGLCVDCGQRLDDLPADHSHEIVDARWAGLAEKFGTPADSTPSSSPGTPGEIPTTEEN
jgi:uncharacterized metal-binding protein YceD (DUF177 family)